MERGATGIVMIRGTKRRTNGKRALPDRLGDPLSPAIPKFALFRRAIACEGSVAIRLPTDFPRRPDGVGGETPATESAADRPRTDQIVWRTVDSAGGVHGWRGDLLGERLT